MNLNVLVFASEDGLRELLRVFLQYHGHEVQAFWGPSVCPLYQGRHDESCRCPKESPCADVMIIDSDMPESVLEFLRFLRRRGCKALDTNKALMSARLPPPLAQAVKEFGCRHIVKPFQLSEIKAWIEECAERLDARDASG